MPNVSVLIPIYNVEKYLRECLDSVISQTLTDIEIICINDGSTDGSLAIIQEYARADSRIVVIDKENTGYGDSMNQGLRRARGKYIGIVESDDWAEPDMFASLLNLAESHDAEIAKGEHYNYYTDPAKSALNGQKSWLILDSEIGRVIRPRENIHIFFQQPTIWTAIYRSDFLEAHGIDFLPTPGASYQDTSFSFKTLAAAERVIYTKDAHLHYRRDSEGSSVADPGKTFCVVDEYDEIERFVTNLPDSEDLLRVMRAARWATYRWNFDRLKPELAEAFLRRASEQYVRERERGVFRFQYCDVNRVREITELMDDPELAIARMKARAAAKVSVVFPVYNVERYVESSLKSLLAQSLAEIEVVVVDDGSSDTSIDVVERYVARDPRIRLFSQENRGLSAARNVGMALAAADYIAFLDSDDTFDPDALERMYTAMLEHDVPLVIGSSRVAFEPGLRSVIDKYADIDYSRGRFDGKHTVTPSILKWVDVHVWNKMYSKEVLRNRAIDFPQGLKYEDAYFFNAYAWNVETCYFLDPDKPVHTYLRRAGAIMTETFAGSKSAIDHLDIAYALHRPLVESGKEAQYGSYYLWVLERHLRLALLHTRAVDHNEVWRSMRQFLATHRDELIRLDADRYRELEYRVFPRYLQKLGKIPAVQRLVITVGMRAFAAGRSGLSKLSPTVRLQRRTIEELEGLGAALQRQLENQRCQCSAVVSSSGSCCSSGEPSSPNG